MPCSIIDMSKQQKIKYAVVAQLVEYEFSKLGVAGSCPVYGSSPLMCCRNFRSLWPPVRCVDQEGYIFNEPNSLCSQLQAQPLGLLNRNSKSWFRIVCVSGWPLRRSHIFWWWLSFMLCLDWSSWHSMKRFYERKKIKLTINELWKVFFNYG